MVSDFEYDRKLLITEAAISCKATCFTKSDRKGQMCVMLDANSICLSQAINR